MRYTPAQARRIKREQNNEKRKREDRDEKYIHADSIMREYEKAYTAYNGLDLRLQYMNGWVRQTPMAGRNPTWETARLTDLPRRTQELWARVHERDNASEQT